MERVVDGYVAEVGTKPKSLDELKAKGLLVYRVWYERNLRGFNEIGNIICKRFKFKEEEVKAILKQEKRKYYKRNYRKELKNKKEALQSPIILNDVSGKVKK